MNAQKASDLESKQEKPSNRKKKKKNPKALPFNVCLYTSVMHG